MGGGADVQSSGQVRAAALESNSPLSTSSLGFKTQYNLH